MRLLDFFKKSDTVEKVRDKAIEFHQKNDYSAALEYIREGIRMGDAQCKLMYSAYLLSGKVVERNIPQAIAYMIEASDTGYVPATMSLSNLYWEGSLVDRNPEKAISLMKSAAETGYDDAQYQLGLMYGVMGDLAEAYRWFALAADQGHEKAIQNCEDLLADCGEG